MSIRRTNLRWTEQTRKQRQQTLRGCVKGLTKTMSAAEKALWLRLKDCQLGPMFQCQVPLLGRYVVDFYQKALRLVVEVDGGYHTEAKQAEKDRKRDEALAAKRHCVLRFTDRDVLDNMDSVVARIQAMVKARQPRYSIGG